jgi:hypothetical protein
MTGIVNIYVKGTDRIRKYSHPVYRGLDLLSGFFTQLEGLHYVVRSTEASVSAATDPSRSGTTAAHAPYQELYYANSWKDVPTDTSVFTAANSITSGETDASVIDTVPLLVQNYVRGEQFSTLSDGWSKETDYNISLFAHKAVGASRHGYECGYIWWRGTSYSSALGVNGNGDLTKVGKSANASVVGCDADRGIAGRTLSAAISVAISSGACAGGFAHPQITV